MTSKKIRHFNGYTTRSTTLVVASLLILGITGVSATAATRDAENQGSDISVETIKQMFEKGKAGGYIRAQWDYTNNAFFIKGKNPRTAAIGGNLHFTTASLHGVSLRLGLYAQRNVHRSNNPSERVRPLANNLNTLGVANVQWQHDNFLIRAGNQKLYAPFTRSFDFRIIPETYQGVKLRYGDDKYYIKAMRMFRYKARSHSSFQRQTNYSLTDFPPPHAQGETSGFWALGAGDTLTNNSFKMNSQAWFFNYRDYANLYYLDSTLNVNMDQWSPYFGLQWIRETDTGKALLGNVDHHTYGVKAGIRQDSLKFELSYDYIPHRHDSFLNGGLVAPYAHAVGDIPYFAHPLPNSVEDLGSGNITRVSIAGAPIRNAHAGLSYTYADLTTDPAKGSQKISEFALMMKYNFSGALDGLSVHENFAYQTSPYYDKDFYTSRLGFAYSF